MELKHIIQELNSDIAYTAQISDWLQNYVLSIRNKCITVNNQINQTNLTIEDINSGNEYFLQRELYDIDPLLLSHISSELDTTITLLKRCYSEPFAVDAPTYYGVCYRNWLQPVRAVSVDIEFTAVIDGISLWNEGDRVLLVNQEVPTANGVYEYIDGVWVVKDTDFRNGTVYVSSGTKYHDTVWFNTNNENVFIEGWTCLKFIPVREYTLPDGLSGNALYAARSAQINGSNYFNVVSNIALIIDSVKQTCVDYASALQTLRQTNQIDATLQQCNIVIGIKQALDATVASLSTSMLDLIRFASNYTDGDRLNDINAGFYNKPHKTINTLISKFNVDKLYNNNHSRLNGDGAGGVSPFNRASINDTLTIISENINNHNAIIEYWYQIGWIAAERTGNYKSYINLHEQDMREKNLEEILEMHDKAVYNTYRKETPKPNGFLHPLSPEPLSKPDRIEPDSSLPYTIQELMDRGLL